MSTSKEPWPDFSDVKGDASSTAPTPFGEVEPIVRTHTVAKGESLSKIAKTYYGKASLWKALYEANKEVVGNNPDLINPGQVLTIPEFGDKA